MTFEEILILWYYERFADIHAGIVLRIGLCFPSRGPFWFCMTEISV